MLTPARGMVTRRRRSWTRVAQLVTGLALVAVATGCGGSSGAAAVLHGALRVALQPAEAVTGGARWSVDGGPAQVSGATVTDLTVGNHTVRFTAVDGFTKPADQVVAITANQTTDATGTYVAVGPQAPVADAGADQTVQLPAGASLNGTATPNAAVPAWTQVSGPAAAVFTNANAPVTTVTLPAAGDYVFRLTATNGTDTTSDDVLVRAIAPVNGAPNPQAGDDQNVTFGVAANLDGTVTDDGLPAPANLTTTWSQVSGPAGVTFGDAASVDTTANFPTAGVYVLRLTANDGAASASDEVQITVTFAVQPVTSTVASVFVPTTYAIGQPVTVTLTAKPSTYAQTVETWSLVETIPAGWDVNISSITGSGEYNASTRQIRWGVFTNANDVTVTYQVTPTAGTTGEQTFTGYAAYTGNGFAGVHDPISGWRSITPAS